MAERLFMAQLTISLGANAQGSAQYQNSANQEFHITQIVQKTTGTANIIDFSNNASQQYSNASESDPLNIEVFPDMNLDTGSKSELALPIVLQGQEQVKFTVVDTSGSANTVEIGLIGHLVY